MLPQIFNSPPPSSPPNSIPTTHPSPASCLNLPILPTFNSSSCIYRQPSKSPPSLSPINCHRRAPQFPRILYEHPSTHASMALSPTFQFLTFCPSSFPPPTPSCRKHTLSLWRPLVGRVHIQKKRAHTAPPWANHSAQWHTFSGRFWLNFRATLHSNIYSRKFPDFLFFFLTGLFPQILLKSPCCQLVLSYALLPAQLPSLECVSYVIFLEFAMSFVDIWAYPSSIMIPAADAPVNAWGGQLCLWRQAPVATGLLLHFAAANRPSIAPFRVASILDIHWCAQ